MSRNTVDLTVVIDSDSNECLYKNGVAWEAKGETTVYVSDLVEASGGFLIYLQHKSIDFFHDEWPDELSDALAKPPLGTMPASADESSAASSRAPSVTPPAKAR